VGALLGASRSSCSSCRAITGECAVTDAAENIWANDSQAVFIAQDRVRGERENSQTESSQQCAEQCPSESVYLLSADCSLSGRYHGLLCGKYARGELQEHEVFVTAVLILSLKA
jgi:hypothetical protein